MKANRFSKTRAQAGELLLEGLQEVKIHAMRTPQGGLAIDVTMTAGFGKFCERDNPGPGFNLAADLLSILQDAAQAAEAAEEERLRRDEAEGGLLDGDSDE